MISFCVLNGMVHIRHEYRSICRPVIDVHYYPSGIAEKDFIFFNGPIEDQEISQNGNNHGLGYSGVYPYRNKKFSSMPYKLLHLPELAKTIATKTEQIPILCPKVRKGIKTRWNADPYIPRWEKELKNGWVPA